MELTVFEGRPFPLLHPVVLVVHASVGEDESDGFSAALDGEINQLVFRHPCLFILLLSIVSSLYHLFTLLDLPEIIIFDSFL